MYKDKAVFVHMVRGATPDQTRIASAVYRQLHDVLVSTLEDFGVHGVETSIVTIDDHLYEDIHDVLQAEADRQGMKLGDTLSIFRDRDGNEIRRELDAGSKDIDVPATTKEMMA